MRIFMFSAFLTCALAELPVGGGYPAARSSHDHDHSLNIQGVLPQEFGSPIIGARNQKGYDSAVSRSQISSYIPASKSSVSQKYGLPEYRSSLSQEYGAPSLTSSPSQEYRVPSARLSLQYRPPNQINTPSTEYGAPSYSTDFNTPNVRISQEYGVLELRDSEKYETMGDFPSDSYRAPLQRSPSTQYGQPELKSGPSEEYSVFGPNNLLSSQKSVSSSQNYPGFRSVQNVNTLSHQNSVQSRQNKPSSVVTRNFQSSLLSRNDGTQSFSNARPVFSRHQIPSTRNSDSYTPKTQSISQSYLPSSRTVSQTYGAPNERSLSAEFTGPSEAKTNLKTNTFAPSYVENRPDPSAKYGVPSARDAMPSDQYGVPEQYDSQSNQGYNYARNALDELLNQEPAIYDFGYKVNDIDSGSDFGHTESRQDNKVEGTYFLVLPDGTKQVIEYEADERGFRPRISVEPAEVSSGSGHDDNASDLDRSGDGPY
ncbi:unnamed protein product, partial [Brenthis ino]